MIIATFMFAAWANVNQGVIGSLLTANIFYSSVIFYLVYGEKISMKTAVAMCLLFGGVFFVSVKDESNDLKIDYFYLLLSVSMSQITTFFFSINQFLTKVYLSPGKAYGFTPLRFTVDSLFISSTLQMPGLIYCHFWVVPYDL